VRYQRGQKGGTLLIFLYYVGFIVSSIDQVDRVILGFPYDGC